MKLIQVTLLATSLTMVPILGHAAEPATPTAMVTTVTAASTFPVAAGMDRSRADSARARRIAMDDKISAMHEYDSMYSH